MTVFQRTIIRLSEIARDIKAAINGETKRLREEVSALQEANTYQYERAEADAVRAWRATQEAQDEANEARRVRWEAADKDSERERLIRDLEKARFSGSDYEEQRIIDRLKGVGP